MENNYNNNFNSGSPYSYNQTNQQTGDGTNTSWSSQVNGNTSQGYSQGTQYGQENAYYSQGTQYGQGNAYYSQGTQPYGQNQQKKKRKEKVKKEHGKGGFGVKLAKCAAIALVFGLISGSVFAGTNQLLGTKWSNSESAKTEASLNKSSSGDTVKAANTSSKAVTDLTDVSDIADNVMPSIVAITNMSEKQVSTWYGYTASQPQESCGSGIIVSQDDQYIYVATNNHVVSGATTLSVCFVGNDVVNAEEETVDMSGSDGDVNVEDAVSAKIKGTDESNDLAVVAVQKSDIPEDTLSQIKIAQLGNSDDLQVGEQVVAIGNALGYGQSVTSGWISALNRNISTDDGTSSGLIQTDAAINPGNSGGALLNMQGEVIGINSAKYADSAVEGMGYAIPISKAQPILEELMNRQTRDKVESENAAYLGVVTADLSTEAIQMYDMPEGAFVIRVEKNSAAGKAGIQKGDIIVSFDGQTVSGKDDLESKLAYYASGETVDVVVSRADNGEYVQKTISVTLGSKN